MQDFFVVKTDRKTLCLRILRDGRVEVRAPRRCSDARIRKFVEEHQAWIETHQRQVLARQAEEAVSPEEEACLRRLAERVLPLKVAYYAERMGVKPTSVKITSAKTRFGSCNSKNGICFSWRLMQKPQEAIDYVVVHELAHIKQHNHSPAFYKVVEKEMPDYKERVRLLRGR